MDFIQKTCIRKNITYVEIILCFWSWNMKWKDPSGQFLYFNLKRAQMWITQNNGIRTILVEGKKWPSHRFWSSYWKELMNKWIIKESKLLIWLPLMNNTQQWFWYAPELCQALHSQLDSVQNRIHSKQQHCVMHTLMCTWLSLETIPFTRRCFSDTVWALQWRAQFSYFLVWKGKG